jgi:hypothetical protein
VKQLLAHPGPVTGTFLSGRYQRIACRGAEEVIVAVGRSILIIVWHLLPGAEARNTYLGSDFFERRITQNVTSSKL